MASLPAFSALRAREQRINIILPVRLRARSSWTDACILNVSSRGLLVRTSEPAERGSYVELRRDDQVIVARVMWRCGSRIGMRAQDRLPVEVLIASRSAQAARVTADGRQGLERRRVPREKDHSRARGRALEFVSMTVLGATLCVAAFSMVAEGFARPLAKVGSALSGQASLSADIK